MTTSVPTPVIVAVCPALYVTPPTVKVETDKAAAGVPEPLSFVKTLPETGVSSNVVAISLTMETLFAKIKRAAFEVTFPHTKSDCEICNL